MVARKWRLGQRVWRKRYLLVMFVISLLCVIAPPAIAQFLAPASAETHQGQANLSFPGPSTITPSPLTVAQGLIDQGRDRYTAGQFREAVRLLQQAADTYAAEGNTMQQAIALSNLSLAHQALGNWEDANRTIETSLALLTALPPETTGKATVTTQALTIQGRLQYAQGQFQPAFETWQRTTKRYQRLQDKAKVIESQFNQAQALQAMGFYKRAIAQLMEIYHTLAPEPNSPTKVVALHNLGNTLRIAGYLNPVSTTDDQKENDRKKEKLDATTVLDQALVMAQQLDWDGLERDGAIASIYISLGDLNRAKAQHNEQIGKEDEHYEPIATAKEYYGLAIAQAPAAHTQIDARLRIFDLLLPNTQPGSPDWDQALELRDQIQSQLQLLPPSRTTIYQNVSLAEGLIRLKQHLDDTLESAKAMPSGESPEVAEIIHIEAIEPLYWRDIVEILAIANQQAEDLGDQRVQAYVLGTLGEIYEKAGKPKEAQALTQQALELAQTTHASDISYKWYWQLARIYQETDAATQPDATTQPSGSEQEKAERRKETIAAYEQALDAIKELRTDLSGIDNQEIQFSFREQVEPLHREFVAFLLNTEKTPNEDELEKARQTIEELQLAELNNFFREACLEANDVNIEAIDQSAAVIYPILLGDRLDIILSLPISPTDNAPNQTSSSHVSENNENNEQTIPGPNESNESDSSEEPKRQLRYASTPVSADKIEQIFNLSDLIIGDRKDSLAPRFKPYATELHHYLIDPIAEDLRTSGVDTLIFVLDGPLRRLPPAALFDGEKYLIETYNIALAPGLQLTEVAPTDLQTLEVLLGGVSAKNGELSALPFVETELNQIEQAVPSSQRLLNDQFTNQAIEDRFSTAGSPVVHLATHGQFGYTPEKTLLFSWQGELNINELGELLQSRELNRRRPVELLVLSACETADGGSRVPLGLAGMAVRSGARSTLATLWQVHDQSTATLMTNFYEIWSTGTVTKAEALRQAQLSLLKSDAYSHPFYWAPFVLLGNWL